MKRIFAIALFCTLCRIANAQLPGADAVSGRSLSGQFLIFSGRLDDALSAPAEFSTNDDYVELEPSLLAVSSERIKQALARELSADAGWRGKIHLFLRAASGKEDSITLVSERVRGGWNYRVDLPQFIERQRFVHALVQALLLERANRSAGDRSAEIPAWLAEGLTQHLLSSREMELILPPPRWNVRGLVISPAMVDSRRFDPLGRSRRALRNRPPLTLEELSWPDDEQLAGEAGEMFRRSAQLFVTELLRLKNGRDCLRAMIEELPQSFNWQTAFFRAFHAHFTQQLDLEKWWALQVVFFTGRDPTQLWTIEESWRRLDQIVHTPVDVRRAKNELPGRADVTLQAVIREWDYLHQIPTLKNKLRDLELVRMRAAPEIIPLVDEYRQVLAAYLQHRNRADVKLPISKKVQPQPIPDAPEVLKQLDALDARRMALRPEEKSADKRSAEAKPASP